MMTNIIDYIVTLFIFLLSLFTLVVWSIEALAILHSKKEQDRFRMDPWFASIAFLTSPAVLLLHFFLCILRKFWLFLRLILFTILILLAVLISPAFLLLIPLVYLGYKLLQAAAPLGNRIYNLTLDFYDRLDSRFLGKKPGHLY